MLGKPIASPLGDFLARRLTKAVLSGAYDFRNTGSVSTSVVVITVPTTILAPSTGEVLVFAWGAGGGGTVSGLGGCGGGALFKRSRVIEGQAILLDLGVAGHGFAGGDHTPGTDATHTKITLPDGTLLTAEGGKGNGSGGGFAINGDINRRGGLNGQPGEFGGLAGIGGGTKPGGGAAGFSDIISGALLAGGQGAQISSLSFGIGGNMPGGGGSGSSDDTVTGVGGASEVKIFFLKE